VFVAFRRCRFWCETGAVRERFMTGSNDSGVQSSEHVSIDRCGASRVEDEYEILQLASGWVSLSQTLSCLAVDRESDDDRAQ